MVLKTIRTRGGQGSATVEELVREAREQAGVERILVVYQQQSAQIYVEREAVPRRPQARAS